MGKSFLKPFNLQKWIGENRHLLKPPVGNQQIYHDNEDFIVMVVGGPNARKDFHVNDGEELFYQLEGEIEIGLMIPSSENPLVSVEEKIALKEGDLFLLPSGIPHCPRRPEKSIGMVIERYRNSDEFDGFQWYCEQCKELLHEAKIKVNDIVKQLPVVMNSFYNSEELCTCKNCGFKMERP